MSNIKLQLATLLVWLAVLFNINVFLPTGESLPIFVYVLCIAIGGTMLMMPRLAKTSFTVSIVVTLVVYGLLYILFTNTDNATITVIAGAVAVLITLTIMRWLCNRLLELDLATQNFIVGRGTYGLITRAEGEQKMNDELYRARRFERPLAMVYCTLPDTPSERSVTVETEIINWQISRSLRNRYQQVQIARIASELIHKGDIMIEHQHGVVIALPETNADEAQIFVNQLGRAVSVQMQIKPMIGVARFPDNGLVYEDLVKEAEARTKPWDEQNRDIGHPKHNGDTMSRGNEDIDLSSKQQKANNS